MVLIDDFKVTKICVDSIVYKDKEYLNVFPLDHCQQLSLKITLIEIYVGSDTSDKAMTPARISNYF